MKTWECMITVMPCDFTRNLIKIKHLVFEVKTTSNYTGMISPYHIIRLQ